MKVENDKIKKVIESNVTINYLSKNIILKREEIFRLQYREKLINVIMSKKLYKTAREVRGRFEECLKMNENNNIDF
jgi:hypothetical protein